MDKTKVLKITKVVGLSFFYLIIGLLLLFSIATLSKKRENQIPNIFGFGFLAVHEQADSMDGSNKDSFKPGDLVFVRVLSEKQREELDLKALKENGVVVSFYDYNIKQINTHRVVEYNEETNTIRTKGDKKGLEIDSFYLHDKDIVGIYTGKIKGLGKTISFMQKPLGFGIIVILPMLILLGYQGFKLFNSIYAVKEVKLKEAIEADREKMKKELLAELSKEKEVESEE